MNSLVNLVRENRIFFTISFLLVFIFGIYLSFVSRVDGFKMMNSFHNPFLYNFFNSATFIGDGLFTICISFLLVLFLKKHTKLALLLLVAYLSSGIFAQIFKTIIHAPRPSLYFKLNNYNYYLDTFANSRAGFNSFPSGHSSSAFALITVLSIYCKRKQLCFIFLVIGLVAGYSRIYLAHHFLIDVFVGAIIGILFGSLSVIWVNHNWDNIVRFFAKKLYSSSDEHMPNFPSLQ